MRSCSWLLLFSSILFFRVLIMISLRRITLLMPDVFSVFFNRVRSILSHSALLILCLLPAVVFAHDGDNNGSNEQVSKNAEIKKETKRNLADLQPKAVQLFYKVVGYAG